MYRVWHLMSAISGIVLYNFPKCRSINFPQIERMSRNHRSMQPLGRYVSGQ